MFAATLTYREAYPVGSTDFHKSLQLYRSGGVATPLVAAVLGGCLGVGASDSFASLQLHRSGGAAVQV